MLIQNHVILSSKQDPMKALTTKKGEEEAFSTLSGTTATFHPFCHLGGWSH